MKAFGILSILFGCALVIIFCYGMSEELSKTHLRPWPGMFIALVLLIFGLCVIWFSARTLTTGRFSEEVHDDLLDSPELPAGRRLSPGLRACGVVSLIAAALFILFSGFSITEMLARPHHRFMTQEAIVLGLLAGSGSCLFYVIRKLFLTRKA
jgi:hypothetical protein